MGPDQRLGGVRRSGFLGVLGVLLHIRAQQQQLEAALYLQVPRWGGSAEAGVVEHFHLQKGGGSGHAHYAMTRLMAVRTKAWLVRHLHEEGIRHALTKKCLSPATRPGTNHSRSWPAQLQLVNTSLHSMQQAATKKPVNAGRPHPGA
jgi:hypothetical protein